MYWDDLKRLIRDNQAPNAHVTYYRDPDINPRNMAVFDRLKPNRTWRNDDTDTGHAEEDHWRESHICEAAFFNGEIPLEGSKGYYKDGEFVYEPNRGALSVLTLLISEGCLRRTDELRSFFRINNRSFPPERTPSVS